MPGNADDPRPATPAFRLRRGLGPDQIQQAAQLYQTGFSHLLRLPLGRGPRGAALLARVIDPVRAIVAEDAAGAVLGMVGLRDRWGGLIGGEHGDFVAIYGRFGALWRGALLSVWERDVHAGTVLLDGLCVAPHLRRCGIASALVRAAVDEARAQGAAQIRLDVGAANLAARALYERHGFRQVAMRRMGLAAQLSGVGPVLELALDLSAAPRSR